MADLVIGLFGPTASGKSDVAAAVAQLIPAVVVSADAMQVYDGLPILTNRSPHPERLVGIWPLSHEASVGEYAPLAHAAIDERLAAGLTPIVAGGTGLYFRAALAELDFPPARARAHANGGRVYDEDGAEVAHAACGARRGGGGARPSERPPTCRPRARARGGGRLARPAPRPLFGGAWRHPTLVVGLDVPKEPLETRIATRTRRMFDAGVEEEVRHALDAAMSGPRAKSSAWTRSRRFRARRRSRR